MVSTPWSFSSRSRCTAVAWTASSSHSADVFSISGLSTKTCSCMSVDPRSLASIGPRTVLTSGHCSPFRAPTTDPASPSRRARVPGSYRRAAGRQRREWARVPPTAAVHNDAGMREHRYSFEMPHAAPRIWALFQDYDRWTDYAPMVRRVEVLYPGDEHHNGRLRRVIFKMPFGREGTALELVTDVEPDRGYTYTMISDTPGQRPDRPCPARASGRQPHPLPVRRAVQPHLVAVALVRGAHLPVHQQEQRGQHAAGLAVVDRPSRIPARPGRLLTPRRRHR